jgi:hypothetical protein
MRLAIVLWKKPADNKCIVLYSAPNIVSVIKSRRMRWAGHVARMGEGKSRDSSVGIALGYGLDELGFRVRFPAGAENFSLHHRFQKGSGAHPASYPMGTRGFFLGGEEAGA